MNKQRLAHDWFDRPIPPNVQIGQRSWLYSSYAFAHFCSTRPKAVKVGCDTGLYHGTFFDLGPDGEVEIGDFVTIVGAIIASNGRVVIGDYSFVAHEVVLCDEFAALPPAPTRLRLHARSSKDIILERNVWIGARAIIRGGTRIGEGAVVGAASVVDRDVPAYTIYAGNPGRVVREIDSRQ
jgi:acetyltransferase-like isoleucine patch superfamily enzyme